MKYQRLIILFLLCGFLNVTFGQSNDIDDDDEPLTAQDNGTTEITEEQETGWFSKYKDTSGGEVTLETRAFDDDNDPSTKDVGIGMFTRLQHRGDYKPLTSSFRLAGRLDSADRSRNFIYLEEMWLGFRYGILSLKAGSQLYNWSATEAFHPADQLNSRNFDSNLENAEKIGEPSVSLAVEVWQGEITVYYMPYYQLPRFPSSSNRLNFFKVPAGSALGSGLKLDNNGTLSGDSYGHQGAIGFKQSFGDFDAQIHYLNNLNRNYAMPVIRATPGATQIRPMYLRQQQAGGNLQYVLDAWIIKTEFAYRHYQQIDNSVAAQYLTFVNGSAVPIVKPDDHFIAALGLEYGWQFSNGMEMTLLTEAQRFFGLTKTARQNLSTFQYDLLLGTRLAWNDIADKSLLITVIGDLERKQELLINGTYTQRITEQWSFNIAVRRVIAKKKGGFPIGLEALDGANQYTFNLTRYF